MMSLDKLVQVGSTMWLDPANIIGVRWMQGDESLGVPAYTQIIYVDPGPFLPNTVYLTSDWPIQRVQQVLGLVSADTLDEMMEG